MDLLSNSICSVVPFPSVFVFPLVSLRTVPFASLCDSPVSSVLEREILWLRLHPIVWMSISAAPCEIVSLPSKRFFFSIAAPLASPTALAAFVKIGPAFAAAAAASSG